MGKKEEKQLIEVVGSGTNSGDKDKLLKLLYPKQKPAQAAATLEREDVKQLRLTITVANTIDVNITRAECGSTPLILACLNGHLELATLLVQHDADVNRQDLNGNTALHWAAFHDRHDMVELLSKGKVKPNIANRDGETPLHFAIQKMQVGRPMTLVKLLQGGATADLKNNAGDTPLTLAARLNKIDAVSLLVDSCQRLTSDPRPLVEAARTGRLELSEVLLDCGLDPNGLDATLGARPLHEAVQFCRPKICKLLIEFGADSMMTDGKHVTAESLARMLPGGRGPEYLRIFEKGRELEPRKPRAEREREAKIKEAKAKEVTDNLPLMKMFTQWTRNCRPYRTRSCPRNPVFNLFNDDSESLYVIPRGRNNYILFDFGSKFIFNGVRVVGLDSQHSIKNFQILYSESIDGPWRLARAFRAKKGLGDQDFKGFVAVSRYVKFLIVDNYHDDVESSTSFSSLAFYGVDAEMRTFFGDLGLPKYDNDFRDAGYSTITALSYLSVEDVSDVVSKEEHSQMIWSALEHLRKTYQYSTNQNIWWKTEPVSSIGSGQKLPSFSAYVDSGVVDDFVVTAKGGCTLEGKLKVKSVCDPKDRSKASFITFRNITISPIGTYLLEIRSVKNPDVVLKSLTAIEVGDSALQSSELDAFYDSLAERLAFTQIELRRGS